MSTHTTGPWFVAGPNGYVNQTSIRGGTDGLAPICAVYGKGPEHDADCRLIAAAPNLVSALILLEQAYSNRHSPQHRASALANARAAIDKATS